jgi:hypothetical protein
LKIDKTKQKVAKSLKLGAGARSVARPLCGIENFARRSSKYHGKKIPRRPAVPSSIAAQQRRRAAQKIQAEKNGE